MVAAIEVLDLEARLVTRTRNTTEISRPDRRLAVAARYIEDIGRLTQPRQTAVQSANERLAFRDGRAQMAGAGR